MIVRPCAQDHEIDTVVQHLREGRQGAVQEAIDMLLKAKDVIRYAENIMGASSV